MTSTYGVTGQEGQLNKQLSAATEHAHHVVRKAGCSLLSIIN